MSPRPSRQDRIQQDLDELLRQSAMLAKALLVRNGEFFPFGATIEKRGRFTLVTPVPEGESPTAQDVIDAILEDIRSSHGSLRASSMTAMAETESGQDAVRVELEHSGGSSLTIALPYVRGESGFVYGEMEARRAEPRIWTKDAPKTRNRKAPARKSTTAKNKQPSKSTRKPASTSSAKPSPKTSSKPSKAAPKPSTKGGVQSKAAPREASRKGPRKPRSRTEDSSQATGSGRAAHAQLAKAG